MRKTIKTMKKLTYGALAVFLALPIGGRVSGMDSDIESNDTSIESEHYHQDNIQAGDPQYSFNFMDKIKHEWNQGDLSANFDQINDKKRMEMLGDDQFIRFLVKRNPGQVLAMKCFVAHIAEEIKGLEIYLGDDPTLLEKAIAGMIYCINLEDEVLIDLTEEGSKKAMVEVHQGMHDIVSNILKSIEGEITYHQSPIFEEGLSKEYIADIKVRNQWLIQSLEKKHCLQKKGFSIDSSFQSSLIENQARLQELAADGNSMFKEMLKKTTDLVDRCKKTALLVSETHEKLENACKTLEQDSNKDHPFSAMMTWLNEDTNNDDH